MWVVLHDNERARVTTEAVGNVSRVTWPDELTRLTEHWLLNSSLRSCPGSQVHLESTLSGVSTATSEELVATQSLDRYCGSTHLILRLLVLPWWWTGQAFEDLVLLLTLSPRKRGCLFSYSLGTLACSSDKICQNFFSPTC